MLYHYSTHPDMISPTVGVRFTLNPGTQCAEGVGVYFAEEPRPSAADAVASGKACTACVVIDTPASSSGWWKTKPSIARKFKRAITWHTQGRSLHLEVIAMDGIFVFCREHT